MFSLFFLLLLQMIPSADENCGTYLTKDESLNVYQNEAEWLMHGRTVEADGKHVYKEFTSRTWRPRLAHEVFLQWFSISPPNNVNMTWNLAKPLLLNEKDLLIAAYSGSSIMYRK